MSARLGVPRAHFRRTDSTNLRARALAAGGAPHGTLVTAAEQTAGRGRQGRSWTGPPGRALLLSVVLRVFDALLPLRAGLAVAETCGPDARVKWPNDVLLDGRKVAGVLVEARPQEGWAVAGVGLNVAVRPEDLPPEIRELAGTLGRPPSALEDALRELLGVLDTRLADPPPIVLAALRRRDALLDRPLRWDGGSGTGAGIDEQGRLLVRTASGGAVALDAGEVHLGTGAGTAPGMDPITVLRHGDRWAVQEDPSTAPVAEYETRELAEVAARQMAGEREVVVRDDTADDDAGLGSGGGVTEGEARSSDAGIDDRTAGAGSEDETPREPQAGM